MTDVETLKEKGLSISAINLSCGYYNPHTDEEVTIKRDLKKCWRLVQHIIEDCTETYPHEPGGYGFYDMYDDWEIEEEIHSMLQQDPTMTAADIYDMYQTNYPRLSLNDFERIVEEYRMFYEDEDEEILKSNTYENGKKTETEDFEF